MKRKKFIQSSILSLTLGLSGCTTVRGLFNDGNLEIDEVLITEANKRSNPTWVSISIENSGNNSKERTVILKIGTKTIKKEPISVDGRAAVGLQYQIQTKKYSSGVHDLTVSVDDDSVMKEVHIPE